MNAADERVTHEIKEFADQREGDDSPYGWRKYVKSQELYVRYSCWSLIGTITRQVHPETAAHRECEKR